MNKRILVLGLMVLVVVTLVAGRLIQSDDQWASVKAKQFRLLLADTDAERQQGLSGRAGLEADQAMLFVFGQADKHCFWMKDMRFAIDMVWLDAEQRVVDIEPRVQPDSYPDSFCPAQDSRYVLEFRAGTAQQIGLRAGDTVKLQL